MLVLSRKSQDRVKVFMGGVEVVVTVVRIKGNEVRIGFDAPPSVKILRGELNDREADDD